MEAIASVPVDPWQPDVFLAAGALSTDAEAVFRARVCAGYVAPSVRYETPEGVFVGGDRLAVIAERRGPAATWVRGGG